MRNICSIEACGLYVMGHGFCTKHYTRWRRHGHPLAITRIAPGTSSAEKMQIIGYTEVVRVENLGACHEWNGNRAEFGYGHFKLDGKSVKAHRESYRLERGSIPDGMSILHHCDNPPCINPRHLFAGSQVENIRDMNNKGRQSSGRRWTDAKIAQVKAEYRTGAYSQAELERRHEMARGTVSRIMSGKIWKHVP